ncbi:hypothetical protein RND81_05G273700 [Saponaria officinalis]|uniref:Protein kinase domain-containing protein n=1 Tax=Saponaria officinalis TaxID=3572 RepID=A0AAW1L2I1_SAPOF
MNGAGMALLSPALIDAASATIRSKSPHVSQSAASHVSHAPSPSPSATHAPLPPSPTSVSAARLPMSSKSLHKSNSKPHHGLIIWATVAASFAFLIIVAAAAAAFICHRTNRRTKAVSVTPWTTGLSGQLQRAFVSGVPKLKRPELEIACEDFSNIIGSLLDATVYKGILSTGVDIAVVATSVKSPEQWTQTLELQFLNKIETLSKVNHKNFVNLIGYCEEEKPFTRMMVFEYAPNGTLFEHLHIKEAERLDWKMRLRIVMGIAYCLEHMHQLEPPVTHRDILSTSIYLSEDYAAKISDFSFWNNGSMSKMRSPSMQLLEASSTHIKSNVFNFGVLLFEMITGRVFYMDDGCSVAGWVLELLEKDRTPRETMDPTLSYFHEGQVQRLFYIIRDCINLDARDRPSMREVAAQLRQITGMGPEEATPKLSPLWWAELEILSS